MFCFRVFACSVMFNEPLSFTQRVAESLTYAYLLDRASLSDDPVLRLQVGSPPAHHMYAHVHVLVLC